MGNAEVGLSIDFFTRHGEYGWLSNFHRAEITVDDRTWKTTEHYYQAMKSTKKADQDLIRSLATPGEARQMGRQIEMRDDWEDLKIPVMLKALRAKFTQHDDLKAKLLATGTAVLHEDNPTDPFWGKVGRDMLGKLLMKVREELK